MKARRRLVLAALVLAAATAILFAVDPFSSDDDDARVFEPVELDSAAVAAWTKANPWLFRDTTLALFRDRLLLPFAVGNDLGPRSLRRRGEYAELIFPRGRPIHELAFDLERAAERAGYAVAAGREVGNSANRVEYLLRDATGRTHAVRLALGKTVSAGSYSMALVIIGLGGADAADRRAWLDFPVPITLVVPDTLAMPDDGASGPERDVLVELPMEPVSFPTVRPGPRALFIDHGRDDVERILRARLEANPKATGFATRFGDRAIENPDLMGNLMAVLAARRLFFLDLTESPRSLAPSLFLATGVEGLLATAHEPGGERWLTEEVARRIGAARRTGEGVWVLRHAPGLPALLAKVVSAQVEDGSEAVRWVTLRQLRPAQD